MENKIKTAIALTGLAFLTGCATPDWKTKPIEFNCIDYAAAYTRSLKDDGYDCGTADYTKSTGEPHRIVWLQEKESGEYIYVEPFWKDKAILSKGERK